MRYRMFAGFVGVVVLAAALAGCSDSGDTKMNINAGATETPTMTVSPETSPTMGTSEASPGVTSTETVSPSPGATPAAGAPFGPGCAQISQNVRNLMANQTVATAAASNPLLTQFVAAVQKAGLTEQLNSAEGITVFVPTNDAFNKLSQSQLQALLNDQAKLKSVLEYHVVQEQLTPENLAGNHATLQGTDLTVTGSGTSFTVNNTATIVCGNIPTKNATVYLIDGVLMPKS